MTRIAAGLLSLTMLHPAAAAAQQPAAPDPANGHRITIQGYGTTAQRGADSPPPFRNVSPIGEPDAWFAGAGSPVEAFLAQPERRFGASLVIAVDETGRVSGCSPTGPLVALEDRSSAICVWFAGHLGFMPALDENRKPVASSYRMQLFSGPRGRNARSSLFERQDFSPAPPPGPGPIDSREWPPSSEWVTRYTSPAKWRTAPVAGTGSLVASDKVAGLTLSDRRSPLPSCQVLAPSGDAAFDADACEFALQLLPKWNDDSVDRRNSALLVAGSTEPERAFLPATEHRRRAERDPASLAEFYAAIAAKIGPPPDDAPAALELLYRVGPDGRVDACRITQSSGSDAGDFAACDLLAQLARFAPAEDVFGRPTASWQGWNMRRERPDPNDAAP